MNYADRSWYYKPKTPMGVVVILAVIGVVAFFLLSDGMLRSMASEPQLHQTHVRYVWQTASRDKKCIVAVRGKKAVPCGQYTKEEIDSFRLQYEKPARRVLVGNF